MFQKRGVTRLHQWRGVKTKLLHGHPPTPTTPCYRGDCACVCAKLIQKCLTLVTLWMVACQAPLCMGFSRQEYLSGVKPSSRGSS